MTRGDDDREDGSEQDPGAEDASPVDEDEAPPPEATSAPMASFRLPAGFAQSFIPRMDDAVAKMPAPTRAQIKAMTLDASAYAREIMGPLNRRLQEQMESVLPNYDELAKKALKPYNEQVRAQMASVMASLPTFLTPHTGSSVAIDEQAPPPQVPRAAPLGIAKSPPRRTN